MTARPLIALAGGGTGGHVFPMIAVADALRAEADVRVVFVGTARGIETRLIPARGDELELLDVLPIRGKGWRGAVRGASRAALTLPAARKLAVRLGAKAVFAAGGYASGPMALGAWTAKIPIAILAPDVELGLANRWLLPFARRAYVAFRPTENRIGPGIARRTGVPLRGAFRPSPYTADPTRFSVLILGGSQGAKALNEVLPSALVGIARTVPGLSILHQTGEGRAEDVARRYGELGLSRRARVVAFLDDVATELAAADLVVGRAGSSSLAELCAIGRAAVLIPFPSAGAHQAANADALVAVGGAVSIAQSEATPERIEREVVDLAHDVVRRTRMADAARAEGRPDAAREIARDLLDLARVSRQDGGLPSRIAAGIAFAGTALGTAAGGAHV
jgi:UDP-N-acetylglucosamine--N-acetylmuramyl-(pentapeptide) pyrophosphoryl-undecaprenol N-acetylglucosamine transferase